MTRINVLPVNELAEINVKFLQGEYKEITRVFTHVRKAQAKGKNKRNIGAPKEYTLGKGHVLFFYDKLGWVLNRYHELITEMNSRGFKTNPLSDEQLLEGVSSHWMGDYEVTLEARRINLERLDERLIAMAA